MNNQLIIQAKSIATFALIAIFFSCEKPLSYSIVKNWPIVPEALVFGQVTGVDVYHSDEIVVFHRADRGRMDPQQANPIKSPTILIFTSETGEFVDYLGENAFMMHQGICNAQKTTI